LTRGEFVLRSSNWVRFAKGGSILVKEASSVPGLSDPEETHKAHPARGQGTCRFPLMVK
jgi:hypothetical protein